MPEPQSTLFFLLMMILFGGLIWWMVVARQLVFRVLAACLAFVPAMMFGVAAVNKYYDYYQNWHAAIEDLTNQGPQAVVVRSTKKLGPGFGSFLGRAVNISLARQQGVLFTVHIHGNASNISRQVYVYLPPEYFQTAYAKYRFPAIELIHGFPGQPVDWITVLDVNSLLDSLVSQGRAKPAVLVMPDANGGRRISLQCLNQAGGPADATYLAKDLPSFISRHLRVQKPGLGWGIAGYSEGGFCAANLGLQYGGVYSYAGVLSGYFVPSDNQLTDPSRKVSPFGGNRGLALQNTPQAEIKLLPAGHPIPQFWLGAGRLDSADVRSATYFDLLLANRQPSVRVKFVPGGGHTMLTWRALLPPMLEWMSQGLATQVSLHDARLAREHAAAVAAAKRHKLAEQQKLQPHQKTALPHKTPQHK